MPKARAHPDQFGFAFEPPKKATAPASLAGLERQICGAVGVILASCGHSREIIAARMSEILGDEISRLMLDAYASPAREGHKVPMTRFLALVAVTNRFDVLDQVMREIGAAVLVDDEVHTALIGQLELEIADKNRRLRELKAKAPLIRGGMTA